MRLTIVADDGAVGVGGEFISGLDLSALDPTVHAVQWYGEYGEVEFKTVFQGGRPAHPENQYITDVSPYQFAVNAWRTVKDAQIAEEQSRIIPVTEVGE
jgi:hypothetical protein